MTNLSWSKWQNPYGILLNCLLFFYEPSELTYVPLPASVTRKLIFLLNWLLEFSCSLITSEVEALREALFIVRFRCHYENQLGCKYVFYNHPKEWVQCLALGMKGWECGPASSEKVQETTLGVWEVSAPSKPDLAMLLMEQRCLLLSLSTPFPIAATFYAPSPSAEAGAAGVVLVSALLAGLWLGWREANDYPWKIFNSQVTYIQIKFDTSNNARGLGVI